MIVCRNCWGKYWGFQHKILMTLGKIGPKNCRGKLWNCKITSPSLLPMQIDPNFAGCFFSLPNNRRSFQPYVHPLILRQLTWDFLQKYNFHSTHESTLLMRVSQNFNTFTMRLLLLPYMGRKHLKFSEAAIRRSDISSKHVDHKSFSGTFFEIG